MTLFSPFLAILLYNAGDAAGTNRLTPFTNSERETGFQSDRVDQFDTGIDVITRHDHFHTLGQS
jgi:hypothetical protein